MSIEKTGTFTIDLEPNWNEIIQVALEMLDNADPEMKKVGAEMVQTCAEPMAAKGGHLIIGENTNFCESCLDDRVLKSGELVEFARSATVHIIESGGLQAYNFLKLIGRWWEADRQIRNGKLTFTDRREGSPISSKDLALHENGEFWNVADVLSWDDGEGYIDYRLAPPIFI